MQEFKWGPSSVNCCCVCHFSKSTAWEHHCPYTASSCSRSPPNCRMPWVVSVCTAKPSLPSTQDTWALGPWEESKLGSLKDLPNCCSEQRHGSISFWYCDKGIKDSNETMERMQKDSYVCKKQKQRNVAIGGKRSQIFLHLQEKPSPYRLSWLHHLRTDRKWKCYSPIFKLCN